MKKAVAIIITILMLFAVCSCQSSEPVNYYELVNGTWKTGEIDIADTINKMIDESTVFTDEQKNGLLKTDVFKIGLIITFDTEKNYTLKFDNLILESSYNHIADYWIANYRTLIQDIITQKQLNITVEEYIDNYKKYSKNPESFDLLTTFKSMAEELVTSLGLDSEIASGTYNIYDGKIYFKDTTTSLSVLGDYYTYTLVDNTFTLNNFFSGDGIIQDNNDLVGYAKLPIAFIKDNT